MSASKGAAHRIGPEDFLYGTVLGEGAYAKVMHVRLYLQSPAVANPGSVSAAASSASPASGASAATTIYRGKDYAMKIMEKNHIKKEKKAAFVMMERSVMSRATHPNVVKLSFTFQDRDNLFLVMDLCKGRELLKAIRDYTVHNERSGLHHAGCPEDLARFYCGQTVSALEYLHCALKVVHRDVKPENLLLTEKGHLKLSDFGSAKDEGPATAAAEAAAEARRAAMRGGIESAAATAAPPPSPANQLVAETENAFVGTAEYCSPELLDDSIELALFDDDDDHDDGEEAPATDAGPGRTGGGGAHAPSDLWALGCVLYQLLTGRPPFQDPGRSEYLTFQQIIGYDRELTVLLAEAMDAWRDKEEEREKGSVDGHFGSSKRKHGHVYGHGHGLRRYQDLSLTLGGRGYKLCGPGGDGRRRSTRGGSDHSISIHSGLSSLLQHTGDSNTTSDATTAAPPAAEQHPFFPINKTPIATPGSAGKPASSPQQGSNPASSRRSRGVSFSAAVLAATASADDEDNATNNDAHSSTGGAAASASKAKSPAPSNGAADDHKDEDDVEEQALRLLSSKAGIMWLEPLQPQLQAQAAIPRKSISPKASFFFSNAAGAAGSASDAGGPGGEAAGEDERTEPPILSSPLARRLSQNLPIGADGLTSTGPSVLPSAVSGASSSSYGPTMSSVLLFPPSVSREARDLILALLHPDPSKRLGVYQKPRRGRRKEAQQGASEGADEADFSGVVGTDDGLSIVTTTTVMSPGPSPSPGSALVDMSCDTTLATPSSAAAMPTPVNGSAPQHPLVSRAISETAALESIKHPAAPPFPLPSPIGLSPADSMTGSEAASLLSPAFAYRQFNRHNSAATTTATAPPQPLERQEQQPPRARPVRCGRVLLDYEAIKGHPFFKSVEWTSISDPKRSRPPCGFVPLKPLGHSADDKDHSQELFHLPEPRPLPSFTVASAIQAAIAAVTQALAAPPPHSHPHHLSAEDLRKHLAVLQASLASAPKSASAVVPLSVSLQMRMAADDEEGNGEADPDLAELRKAGVGIALQPSATAAVARLSALPPPITVPASVLGGGLYPLSSASSSLPPLAPGGLVLTVEQASAMIRRPSPSVFISSSSGASVGGGTGAGAGGATPVVGGGDISGGSPRLSPAPRPSSASKLFGGLSGFSRLQQQQQQQGSGNKPDDAAMSAALLLSEAELSRALPGSSASQQVLSSSAPSAPASFLLRNDDARETITAPVAVPQAPAGGGSPKASSSSSSWWQAPGLTWLGGNEASNAASSVAAGSVTPLHSARKSVASLGQAQSMAAAAAAVGSASSLPLDTPLSGFALGDSGALTSTAASSNVGRTQSVIRSAITIPQRALPHNTPRAGSPLPEVSLILLPGDVSVPVPVTGFAGGVIGLSEAATKGKASSGTGTGASKAKDKDAGVFQSLSSLVEDDYCDRRMLSNAAAAQSTDNNASSIAATVRAPSPMSLSATSSSASAEGNSTAPAPAPAAGSSGPNTAADLPTAFSAPLPASTTTSTPASAVAAPSAPSSASSAFWRRWLQADEAVLLHAYCVKQMLPAHTTTTTTATAAAADGEREPASVPTPSQSSSSGGIPSSGAAATPLPAEPPSDKSTAVVPASTKDKDKDKDKDPFSFAGFVGSIFLGPASTLVASFGGSSTYFYERELLLVQSPSKGTYRLLYLVPYSRSVRTAWTWPSASSSQAPISVALHLQLPQGPTVPTAAPAIASATAAPAAAVSLLSEPAQASAAAASVPEEATHAAPPTNPPARKSSFLEVLADAADTLKRRLSRDSAGSGSTGGGHTDKEKDSSSSAAATAAAPATLTATSDTSVPAPATAAAPQPPPPASSSTTAAAAPTPTQSASAGGSLFSRTKIKGWFGGAATASSGAAAPAPAPAPAGGASSSAAAVTQKTPAVPPPAPAAPAPVAAVSALSSASGAGGETAASSSQDAAAKDTSQGQGQGLVVDIAVPGERTIKLLFKRFGLPVQAEAASGEPLSTSSMTQARSQLAAVLGRAGIQVKIQ